MEIGKRDYTSVKGNAGNLPQSSNGDAKEKGEGDLLVSITPMLPGR
jgi:hypothetical protein